AGLGFPRWGAAGSALIFCTSVASTSVALAARPWPARAPSVEPKPAHQLRNLATWPAEPETPPTIDAERFHAAFARLCAVDADGGVAALSGDVLTAAGAAEIDPFELAALAFTASDCDAKLKTRAGVGLLAIDAAMYRQAGAPKLDAELRRLLTTRRLLDPTTNLAVGAKLLALWKQTHLASDAAFGGVAHRDAVSHFIWGDEVRSSGHEDLVLTARRRMLVAYAGAAEVARPTRVGIDMLSPLEAPPRVATSGPGEERDGGARQHRGLDLTASLGEPVRAAADGSVIFAGANLVGHPRHGGIPPSKIARFAHRRLGVGGIYVCIDHDGAERKVVTCYMHLRSYLVSERDRVTAGQTIGFVGTTGVKVSPPHLHFEVRVDDAFTNPLRVLGDWAIPPKATMTHYYLLKAKRGRLHARAGDGGAPPAQRLRFAALLAGAGGNAL
ncbi:MAG TPA: M23 family metallopeptidase, partial [Polyangia bacterium]|nr:M23 family metallopeptidase [Polyangia bacterium]